MLNRRPPLTHWWIRTWLVLLLAGSPVAAQEPQTIEIQATGNFTWSPAEPTVRPGDTVMWKVQQGLHGLRFVDWDETRSVLDLQSVTGGVPFNEQTGENTSNSSSPGTVFLKAVIKEVGNPPEEIPFRCRVHSNMTGKLVLAGNATSVKAIAGHSENNEHFWDPEDLEVSVGDVVEWKIGAGFHGLRFENWDQVKPAFDIMNVNGQVPFDESTGQNTGNTSQADRTLLRATVAAIPDGVNQVTYHCRVHGTNMSGALQLKPVEEPDEPDEPGEPGAPEEPEPEQPIDARLTELPASEACRLVDFEEIRIVPGVVTGTWILMVKGTAPCANMQVQLAPHVYVQQPNYWGIEVVGCVAGGIWLPQTAPYTAVLPLAGVTGKQGVEVLGATQREKRDVPPQEGGGNGGPAPAADRPVSPVPAPEQFDRPQLGPALIESSDFIHAAQAREAFGVDGSGLAVAVLDTGLRTTHNDFTGRVVAQRNFTTDNGEDVNNASDGNGHGTNVAGIIVANGSHRGIAPGANVIPLKVLRNSGGGTFASVEDALQWVIDNRQNHGISVVNMSLGDSSNLTDDNAMSEDDRIRQHIRTLREANVPVVISAGNDFFTHDSQQGMGYPAIFRESISVGAVYDASEGGFTYSSGAVAFSSGPGHVTPFSQRLHHEINAHTRTDIFSPGAPVTSSGIASDIGESIQHGTSQAAPVTSGVILLMQQFHQNLTGSLPAVENLETWLRTGPTIHDGDDEDDNVNNTNLDYVRLDAMTALGAIRRHMRLRMLREGRGMQSVYGTQPPEKTVVPQAYLK